MMNGVLCWGWWGETSKPLFREAKTDQKPVYKAVNEREGGGGGVFRCAVRRAWLCDSSQRCGSRSLGGWWAAVGKGLVHPLKTSPRLWEAPLGMKEHVPPLLIIRSFPSRPRYSFLYHPSWSLFLYFDALWTPLRVPPHHRHTHIHTHPQRNKYAFIWYLARPLQPLLSCSQYSGHIECKCQSA